MAQTVVFILSVSRLCQASDNATAGLPREGWVSQPDGRGTFDILWYDVRPIISTRN